MVNRQTKIDQAELQKLGHLDVSIQHWSVEHAKLSLQQRAALETLDNLYRAREQLLFRAYKEAGIDPSTIIEARVMKDGTVTVLCQDPMPSSPTDAPVPPAQEAPAQEAPPSAPAQEAPTTS